jgi:hypothetical protein
MTSRKASLAFILMAAALAGAFAAPAQAQMRVFVAAQGSDGNPCTFAAPCRTFQHAHDTVAANGEIDVLDPAGYGPLTITKPISIQGHGFSGISVPSGADGITVNAGASDIVSVNGLIVDGAGVGLTGIVFNSGRALVVENCVVRRIGGHGLDFRSTATTKQTLAVSKSSFAHNVKDGIFIDAEGSGGVRASIEHVVLYGNANGLDLFGGRNAGFVAAVVTDSVATESVGTDSTDGNGFLANSEREQITSNKLLLTLTRSTAANNFTGVLALGWQAAIRLAQSTIVDNDRNYAILAGGNIYSYGDNYIDGFGTNTGTLGPDPKH